MAGSPVIQAALSDVDGICEQLLDGLELAGLKLGFSVEIVYLNQSLYSKSFGVATPSTLSPPTRDSVYRCGSVTKIFTSLLLELGISEGLVSGDTPVSAFFNSKKPPVFSPPNAQGAVTLESLASHTSGLAREGVGCHFATNCSAGPVFDAINKFGLFWPPFEQPHYSNLGAALLGRTLERAFGTGDSYEALVASKILAPLGMTRSGFALTAEMRKDLITGYAVGVNPPSQTPDPWNTVDQGWITPAAGLFSTPRDLAAFMSAVLSTLAGDPVPPFSESVALRYVRPGALFPTGVSGFGAATMEQFYAHGQWTQTKGGLVAGYGMELVMSPSLGIGISLNINADDGIDPSTFTTLIFNALAPAVSRVLANATRSHPLPANVTAVVGSWGADGQTLVQVGQPNALGVFSGNIPFLNIPRGLAFTFAPELSSPSAGIALRYAPVDPGSSCFVEYGSGQQGVLWISKDGEVCDLVDQGILGLVRLDSSRSRS